MKTILTIICCCLLAACHRAPQTAADLWNKLPRKYQGELHVQGEPQARQIVIEPLQMLVRDTHLLEFGRVRYQFSASGEVGATGEAQIRGTISAPGLIINVESLTGGGDVDGGDVLKAGTFQGKLSSDLQKLEATWKTGFGQNITLEVQAVP